MSKDNVPFRVSDSTDSNGFPPPAQRPNGERAGQVPANGHISVGLGQGTTGGICPPLWVGQHLRLPR